MLCLVAGHIASGLWLHCIWMLVTLHVVAGCIASGGWSLCPCSHEAEEDDASVWIIASFLLFISVWDTAHGLLLVHSG